MDYLSVTQTAFFTATALNIVVVLLLAGYIAKHPSFALYSVGFTVQSLWLFSIWMSYSHYLVSSQLALLAELIRYAGWIIVLILLLQRQSKISSWPMLFWITVSVAALSVVISTLLVVTSIGSIESISISFAVIAGVLIVLTEQVTRNSQALRITKLIGLALILQFLLDAFLYAQMSFNSSLAIGVWQARAALSFITALAIALGTILFSDHKLPASMTVSRPVMFYTTSATLVFLTALFAGIGAFYVESMGGFVGSYLFMLALIAALFFIIAILISKRAKQNIEVFISKHFFNLKYDYREQWLNTIAFTTEHNPSESTYEQAALTHIQKTFRAKSGVLWMVEGGTLIPTAKTKHLKSVPTFDISDSFIKTMVMESWIFSPLSHSGSLADNNQQLPAWFSENDMWMISPLICRMKLIGIVAIGTPSQDSNVTFEDRDLMTNITNQISTQLLVHQQEQTIGNNKQLETYNRLSAFIMHDVNNVIAQLALIGRNAEKHKSNPAFIDDMIKTVKNAVERMQSMIQKFKPDSKEKVEELNMAALVEELIEACSDKKPLPTFLKEVDFSVRADKQKLYFSLKNLIRNAQDATQDSGSVSIQSRIDQNGQKVLSITDTGMGMTADFIRTQLFMPFNSTKDDQGMGLGAHLSKNYLDQIGANINVSSKPEHGTRFDIVWH